MSSAKEHVKERGAKRAPVGKNAAKLKVVDVELKSKGKIKATSAKSAAAEATRGKTNGVKELLAKKLGAKSAVKEKDKAKVAKTIVKDIETDGDGALGVPTEKLLRPFRRAAELNRQQARQAQRARAQKGAFLAKPLKKGKRYLLDLRVHSAGTVGYFTNGGIDPGPALIRLASVKGLHMISLTEYYDASMIDQVRRALTPESELIILPSVVISCEVNGCKDVPILVLFPDTITSAEVFAFLDALEVPKAAYGKKDFCLPMDLGKILEIIEAHGALAIPSRIDKTPYRQLAIAELVEKHGMHAFDLAHPDSPDLFRDRWPSGGFTFFSFSSANALGQIGNRVGKVTLAQLGFEGIKELVKRRTGAEAAADTEPQQATEAA